MTSTSIPPYVLDCAKAFSQDPSIDPNSPAYLTLKQYIAALPDTFVDRDGDVTTCQYFVTECHCTDTDSECQDCDGSGILYTENTPEPRIPRLTKLFGRAIALEFG